MFLNFNKMDHHRDYQGKAQGFKEKHPPMLGRSLYAGMTPPPSYHTFDGLWPDQASRPSVPFDHEVGNRVKQQGIVPQRYIARDEHIAINQRSRDDRRKHHRPRRSSSHNSTWTAKLVFQGLRSNLFGLGDTDQAIRESKRRSSTSRTRKPDFSSTSRNIHYNIHNHWHEMSPPEHISRTETWPGHEHNSHGHQLFNDCMSGALPTFGCDAQFATHKNAGPPLHHDYPTSFEPASAHTCLKISMRTQPGTHSLALSLVTLVTGQLIPTVPTMLGGAVNLKLRTRRLMAMLIRRCESQQTRTESAAMREKADAPTPAICIRPIHPTQNMAC